MGKIRVGLFFGGRSVEHEVSVITALQAYENLDKEKYEIIPVYVSKAGEFFTNPKFLDIKNYKDIQSLLYSSTQVSFGRKGHKSGLMVSGRIFGKFIPIDVAFPCFHGSFGEDGAIQGLFEMYQFPIAGLGVTGSAVAMDKAVSKAVFASLGLPIGKYLEIKRMDWISDHASVITEIQNKLEYPLFVKPTTTGSSIGVNKASDKDALNFAIEVATAYSEKVLIEEAFENVIEVNCSALGYKQVKASVCEQPVPSSEILSFADKYQKGGKNSKGVGGMESLQRIIPAPISDGLTKQIQNATVKIFKAIDGCGVIRIDYFVDKDKGKFWVNEINPIPGSLSFYLWDKTGLTYKELLDKLIDLAFERFEEQKKTKYVFESGLLEMMASGKPKGAKA